jgi:hypothetical protein
MARHQQAVGVQVLSPASTHCTFAFFLKKQLRLFETWRFRVAEALDPILRIEKM